MKILKHNDENDRVGIWDTKTHDWSCDGLHCGTCLEVLTDDGWQKTRIEMGEGWYLVGLPLDEHELQGLQVKDN